VDSGQKRLRTFVVKLTSSPFTVLINAYIFYLIRVPLPIETMINETSRAEVGCISVEINCAAAKKAAGFILARNLN